MVPFLKKKYMFFFRILKGGTFLKNTKKKHEFESLNQAASTKDIFFEVLDI